MVSLAFLLALWQRIVQREGEPEGSSLAPGALDADLSSLPTDELLAEVEAQTQAGAPSLLTWCLRDLGKTLPDTFLLVRT